MVKPFGEPGEPKKLVSITEILDRHQAETTSTTPPAVAEPHFETVIGDSVLDKLSNLATWNDIVEPPPLNWKEVKPQDSDTLQAFQRRGGTSPISAKVPKKAPGTIVVWSTDAGLPAGPGQKLNKAKVYAHSHYGGDLSAASKALVRGEAVGLPTVVIAACKIEPRDEFAGLIPPKDPPLDDYPPEDPYQDQPEPDPVVIFAEDVEKEARRLRVRDAAQRKIRREQQRDLGNLEPITLADFLAIPDEPIDYRIDYLWPSGGRIVLAAQWKVGKTTPHRQRHTRPRRRCTVPQPIPHPAHRSDPARLRDGPPQNPAMAT